MAQDTREQIRIKHEINRLKQEVKRFDKELERLRTRAVEGHREAYEWLQSSKDYATRKIFRLKKELEE